MTEKCAAGFKELIFAVLWAAAILIAYDLGDTFIRLRVNGVNGANMTMTIATVAAACVLVYFVMTRYAAVYIYNIDKKSIRLTRKIGHRERSVTIRWPQIVSFSDKKPDMPKKVAKMRKTVFSDKHVRYLIYKENKETLAVVFEPSEKMAAEILSRVKEG